MASLQALGSAFHGIYGDTRILGVFGYPVEHSLSPVMHNAAIAALGLHYTYIPFSVLPDNIGPAIRSLTVLGIVGVNLTIPHKERVLPYLDVIAPEAQAIGAVNTVHNEGGRLIGYNTDGEGFFIPLREQGFDVSGKRTVVLGAGGAARAVVYRLAHEGGRVTLVNRTRDRAARLAAEILRTTRSATVECIDIDDTAGLKDSLAGAELLVNATSVGMSPHAEGPPPIPLQYLHPGLLVYDLIYRPVETRLLAAARSIGAGTLNGVDMLVGQGAASFSIWTGATAPREVMKRAVLQIADVTG